MGIYSKHIAIIAVLITAWGCSKKTESKQKPPPPAKVNNAVKETDLTTITLTSEAESRLGIQTAEVALRAVERSRTFGGEVVSISGRSITISAPLSGTLLSPEEGLANTAGSSVAKGQPLYRLLLVLPEKDLLSIQEEVSIKEIELGLAQTKVKRSQRLLDDKAGSVKQLEEAQAELASVMETLKTARARMELLKKGELDLSSDKLPSLTIKSPLDGIIQEVYVAPGQTVTGTTALIRIVSIDPVWIKVPVYVGDLAAINTAKPARVHSLADFAGAETRTAKPVVAPLSADPESVTADLFYELSNTDLSYRPGQKVSVTLTLKDSSESLVVPYSSIVYDMYGGAWLYQNTEPHVYVRRRVELHHVLDELAILSHGPDVGAKVVSAGAAELFGTEFGVREE
jgi:cobalt-zinc-cadmium efflux system membrane fusion protein